MRPLAAFAVAATLLAAPAAALADDANTLGVQGQGEVELAPDVGGFDAVVRRTSPTSAGARSAANERLSTIVKRLTALSIPRSDITTTNVSLTRVRSRNPKTHALRVRYTASGAFAVRVEGADKVGRALDTAADAGATDLDGPEFSFSQALETQGRLAAEKAALADARGRADAAAASQGQKVTGVRSIELDPGSAATPAAGEASTAAAAPAPARKATVPTPILPGRQTFESTVRVVYLIAAA